MGHDNDIHHVHCDAHETAKRDRPCCSFQRQKDDMQHNNMSEETELSSVYHTRNKLVNTYCEII